MRRNPGRRTPSLMNQGEDGFPDPSRWPESQNQAHQGAMLGESKSSAMPTGGLRAPAIPKFGLVPDDPLWPNPYPADDPRHRVFVDASRCARQELAVFTANALSKL